MSNVFWMPSAVADMQNIREYLAKDSLFFAKKVAEDVLITVEALKDFPEIGQVVPEKEIPTMREVYLGSLRIIYELLYGNVYIVAVLYAAGAGFP